MLKHIGWIGNGLRRPESVLCLADGSLLVSDLAAAVTRIGDRGDQQGLGEVEPDRGFVANGLGLAADGRILIANMGSEGGVWTLLPERPSLEMFLAEADGVPLKAANFVTTSGDRTWITVSTRTVPANAVYNTDIADGFVVLVDPTGARIVADGLRFTNECRPSPDGEWLYVAETAGARISRFKIAQNGDLGTRDLFCQFGDDVYPEGLAFDVEGDLWMTSVISNRIYRVDPWGRATVQFDDADAGHVEAAVSARRQQSLSRDHFYQGAGPVLSSPSSICFVGPQLDRIVIGSLTSPRLAVFAAPVRGQVLHHFNRS